MLKEQRKERFQETLVACVCWDPPWLFYFLRHHFSSNTCKECGCFPQKRPLARPTWGWSHTVSGRREAWGSQALFQAHHSTRRSGGKQNLAVPLSLPLFIHPEVIPPPLFLQLKKATENPETYSGCQSKHMSGDKLDNGRKIGAPILTPPLAPMPTDQVGSGRTAAVCGFYWEPQIQPFSCFSGQRLLKQ